MSDTLVILCKQPIAGRSKTRLARSIGDERARRLAEAFVLDTFALARSIDARTLIAFAPADAREWFAERAPFAELWPQPESDLGGRMDAATRAAFERGARRCVMIGMDTPHLDAAILDEAFRSLDDVDLCVGPAVDGGYYLIGMREPQPVLFRDLPWSTERVAEMTRDVARAAGLTLRELPTQFDVDDVGALERLSSLLRERPDLAPATRAALADPRIGER
ncbi:MAG: TIGR04282 family arsenosugar biosynthesis glycosyltransferase [Planctomycetota bacterium]